MISADEKFVRVYWEHVRSWVRDLDSYGTDQSNVALYYREDDAKYGHDYFQRWQKDVGKEDAVWSSAAEFTRSRLEEIRQVEEEIMRVGGCVRVYEHHTIENSYPLNIAAKECWNRILSREKAALAELKRGMTAGG